MSENVTDFEQKINNINVCLKTGNVAAEDADCIVVPEFRDGASGGGVGYAIETAGMGAGLEAYEKVAQEGFLKDGDAIITESGKPDVKLAHVVTVSAREDSQFEVVNRSVLKTLETANEVGIKRIALPEIGTGIIGSLTQEQSAKAIFNAVYEFSKNNPSSSVEEVSFVVYRSSTEPAKRVLTDKSYIGIMTAEKGNKSLDIEEFVEGLGNHGVRKKAKSPTREEILQDPEARKITGSKMTKLFFAETPEAVDAYIEAGVDINHQDISKETALDWTINRIVRDINTYEDSDNKGAVLQMALKGGKCSEESLEQLKDKDPEFCSKVIEVMKGREKLQDLSTKTVTDTQYPVSGHTDENEEKIVEALGRLAGKIASKGDKHVPLHEFNKVKVPTHEKAHTENQQPISHKEAKELGIKPRLKIKRIWGPRELPDIKITEVYDEKEVAQKRQELRRKDLLNKATLVEIDFGANTTWSSRVDMLCKKMEEEAKSGPVKAEDGERMFVVEEKSNLYQILQAWKEQAYKPWLEERRQNGVPVDGMLDFLDMHDRETRIENSVTAFMQAAMVEQIIEHNPERADKITMLQLLNAYCMTEYKTDISEKLLAELNKSAEKFAKGAEAFPPTLENIVTLNKQREALNFLLSGKFGYDAYKGGTLKADFEKRVGEVELKMLKELTPEDLAEVSDNVIFEGRKIADKHKDAGDFGKLFSDEVMKRLSQGKVFDPRDPNG